MRKMAFAYIFDHYDPTSPLDDEKLMLLVNTFHEKSCVIFQCWHPFDCMCVTTVLDNSSWNTTESWLRITVKFTTACQFDFVRSGNEWNVCFNYRIITLTFNNFVMFYVGPEHTMLMPP